MMKAVKVSQYNWGIDEAPATTIEGGGIYQMNGAAPPRETAIRQSVIDPSAIERDAFTKGYAQGERTGIEAAATRGDAMLRRLAQTLDELGTLRAELIHQSERQVVRLALAIATRVIHREITLDSELLVVMARVALDRLGDASSATIRLHPQDHAAALAVRGVTLSTESVHVVADPNVSRGGCLVESDFGLIDLTPAAQIAEITTALLGPELASALEEAGATVAAL
jgi:flagellar assembly protein FliH